MLNALSTALNWSLPYKHSNENAWWIELSIAVGIKVKPASNKNRFISSKVHTIATSRTNHAQEQKMAHNYNVIIICVQA